MSMFEHEKHLVGVYDTEREAIQAVDELKRQGYAPEEISVIGENHDDVSEINDATGTKTEDDLLTGAATGGALGGVVGLLAGIGALAIPGIGPLVAAGPIAATLGGAAVGAGVGGLAGALIGMGLPEEDANRYEDYVKDGKILVVVERRESRLEESPVGARFNENRVGESPFDAGANQNLTGGPMTSNYPPNAALTSDNPNDPRLR